MDYLSLEILPYALIVLCLFVGVIAIDWLVIQMEQRRRASKPPKEHRTLRVAMDEAMTPAMPQRQPIHRDEVFTCPTCRCLLFKGETAPVYQNGHYLLYFCQTCRPPYDIIIDDDGGPHYFVIAPDRIAVTKDGKPLAPAEGKDPTAAAALPRVGSPEHHVPRRK